MKQYIKPEIKVANLAEECLGPGAGDVSNPHVGDANQIEIFDEDNSFEGNNSVWDE